MSTTQVTPAAETALPTDDAVALRAQIEKDVRAEYQELLLVWEQDKLADLEKRLDKQVNELFEEYWKKWKDEQKPLTQDQIQLLLSQEYVEFKVPIRVNGEVRDFILRELPQSVEQQFYRQFRGKLAQIAPQISGFTQATAGKDNIQLLETFFTTFDSGMEIMAETVALVLDPEHKDEQITKEWVQSTISSSRQYNILRAQAEVNKLRDFFSQLFQAGQQVGTITTPHSFRQLLGQSQ